MVTKRKDAILEVYPPGTEVAISPALIPATIVGVMLAGTNGCIQYNCCWWEAYNRREEWVDACEVKPIGEPPKLKIGFIQKDE